MEKIRKQIVEVIRQANSILVMPSSPPDGDSLGSALALYLVLKKLEKDVTVVCADSIPDSFQFLPTTNVISNQFSAARDFIVTLDCEKAKLNYIKSKVEENKVNIILTAKKGQFSAKDVSFHYGPSKYDLIITVDTADLEQLGRFYEDNTELFTALPLINIDHHASNGHFGRINYVDMMSSATTEIILPLIHSMEESFGVKLMDSDIATLLLAGIITDTGSFQNANTTPRSFAASAQLVRYGARQQEIIQHIFKTKHLSTLKLWGRILTKMTVVPELKFAWSSIDKHDFMDTGSRDDETGGIIDELLTNAPDTEVILLLKEKPDHIISGSLRSTNPAVDVSQIAEMFGGGGHVRAAGFKIRSENFAETEKLVVEKIRDFQKKRVGVMDMTGILPKDLVLKGAYGNNGASEIKIEEVGKGEDKVSVVDKYSEKAEKKVLPTENVVAEGLENSVKALIDELPLKEEKVVKDDGVKTVEKPMKVNDTFVDSIIRRTKDNDSEVELESGVTYKFED